MYNAHRGMPPGPHPGNRLAELLDQVRAEFEAAAGRTNEHEQQCKCAVMHICPMVQLILTGHFASSTPADWRDADGERSDHSARNPAQLDETQVSSTTYQAIITID